MVAGGYEWYRCIPSAAYHSGVDNCCDICGRDDTMGLRPLGCAHSRTTSSGLPSHSLNLPPLHKLRNTHYTSSIKSKYISHIERVVRITVRLAKRKISLT